MPIIVLRLKNLVKNGARLNQILSANWPGGISGLAWHNLKIVRYFSQKPASSIAGLKKILNYSLKGLKEYLEFENRELLRILNERRL